MFVNLKFDLPELFFISLTLIILTLYFVIRKYDFWSSRGVSGPKILPFFGNNFDVFCGRISYVEQIDKWYKKYATKPYIGVYSGCEPYLIVRDPELIKFVLLKNFYAFSKRGVDFNDDVEPLTGNLFNLERSRWKYLRTKLSPIFSSGNLKQMFYLIEECAQYFEKYVDGLTSKNDEIEARNVASQFTSNVIGSCIFGIDLKYMAEEGAMFKKMSRMVFQPSTTVVLEQYFGVVFPRLFKKLRLKRLDKAVNKFFIDIIIQMIEYRKSKGNTRHDFIDLLLRIQEDDKDSVWSIELLAAQVFVFFVAGSDTLTSTISFALYELAQSPKVQDKLREEISSTLEQHDGKITYDALKQMEYLHMVVQETLRKHPPLFYLIRETTEPCTFPGTDVHLKVGNRIIIPAYSIHHDSEYYPEPDVFDPLRFSEEAKQSRPQFTYLPFGDGPRNCIGMRFGNIQTKMALITILKKYNVTTCKNTVIPYVIHKSSLILASANGLPLKLQKL